jgi:hypothetical protein
MLFLTARLSLDDFSQLRVELSNGFVSYKHGLLFTVRKWNVMRGTQYKPSRQQGDLKEMRLKLKPCSFLSITACRPNIGPVFWSRPAHRSGTTDTGPYTARF